MTSLFPSFITFKHFQKPVGLSCSQRILVNRLNSQLLIMQIKIFFLKLFFSKKEFDIYKVVLEVALFLVEQKIAEAKK